MRACKTSKTNLSVFLLSVLLGYFLVENYWFTWDFINWYCPRIGKEGNIQTWMSIIFLIQICSICACFSKLCNVKDAEVRIKSPKTCIFILSKRKDITDQSHHYPIFRKFVTNLSWVKSSLYGGFVFAFGVKLDSRCLKITLNLPEILYILYGRWECVAPTSGIKLNTKKNSCAP